LISEEEQLVMAVGVGVGIVGVGGGFPEIIWALFKIKGRSCGLSTLESLTFTRIIFTGETPSIRAVNVILATIPEPLGPPAVGAPKIAIPISVSVPVVLSQVGYGRIMAKAPWLAAQSR
jgi:hypothetical protein